MMLALLLLCFEAFCCSTLYAIMMDLFNHQHNGTHRCTVSLLLDEWIYYFIAIVAVARNKMD